jgi:hypothetical protein
MRARWPAAPGRRAAAALAVAAFVLLGMSDGINGGGVGATDAGVGVSGGDAGADAADCLRDGVLCGEARAAYPEGAPPSPLLLVPSPPGAFETCSSLLILQQAKHPNPPSWNVTSRAVPSLTAGADLSSASPCPPPPSAICRTLPYKATIGAQRSIVGAVPATCVGSFTAGPYRYIFLSSCTQGVDELLFVTLQLLGSLYVLVFYHMYQRGSGCSPCPPDTAFSC